MLPKSFLEVSQVIRLIKSDLEEDEKLARLWVKGEISNYKKAYSGHIYFTLKDDQASLKCVLFSSHNSRLSFEMEDGMEVLVQGRISVFEATGSVQLYANSVLPLGQGALFLAYTQLKDKLEQEGLFHRKRPIPMLPRRIGIVTSATGSVLHDMHHVARRRNPEAKIILCKSSVQGKEAPKEIVQAIEALNRFGNVDVIIVARGGGSLEDLWAFNTEEVARAIFNSSVPIVSGVGHETDYTISDFVSDMRAPTPSVAAELVIPDMKMRLDQLGYDLGKIQSNMTQMVTNYKNRVKQLSEREAIRNPSWMLQRVHERLDFFQDRANRAFYETIQNKNEQLTLLRGRLFGMNPTATLMRGYTIIEQNGKIIGRRSSLNVNDPFSVQFHDGIVNACVHKEKK